MYKQVGGKLANGFQFITIYCLNFVKYSELKLDKKKKKTHRFHFVVIIITIPFTCVRPDIICSRFMIISFYRVYDINIIITVNGFELERMIL